MFLHAALFAGGSFSGNLCGQPLLLRDRYWFGNAKTHCLVVNCIFNIEGLLFVSLFKVGIKVSKKLPYCM